MYETREHDLGHRKRPTRTVPEWRLPEIRLPDIQIPERQRPSPTWGEEDVPVPEIMPVPDQIPEIDYVPLEPDTGIQRVPIYDPGLSSTTRVDKQKIIDQEKALVEKRFSGKDTLFLQTPYGELLVRRVDFWLALREYKAERIIGIRLSGEKVLMDNGRLEYMKFVSSSGMFARRLVEQMCLDGLSKEKKVEAILLCVQQKETSMKYKYDLNPDNPRDTTCFMRKPVVSLVDGLMEGYVGDCEDFATDFLTLCLAAGIPEQDLVVFHTPGHVFAGIKNFSRKHVDDAYIYIAPDGSVITPIEPTTSANTIIVCDASGEGEMKCDTTYTRARTIGYPNHTEVTMWSKQYPHGVRVKPTVRK